MHILFVFILSQLSGNSPIRPRTSPHAYVRQSGQLRMDQSAHWAHVAEVAWRVQDIKRSTQWQQKSRWRKNGAKGNRNAKNNFFISLQILMHMGFLTKETNLKMSEKAGRGGPLGELVQWSDTIAALHLLGHKLHISTEQSNVLRWREDFVHANLLLLSDLSKPIRMWRRVARCDTLRANLTSFTQTLWVLDNWRENSAINSMHCGENAGKFHALLRIFFSCRLRVLDSFGTQAPFNSVSYYNAHKSELGGKKNPWGGHRLLLRQFYTMYREFSCSTFRPIVKTTNLLVSVQRTLPTTLFSALLSISTTRLCRRSVATGL